MRYFRLCLKSNFGAKNRQETTIFYTRKMFIDARIHCTTTKKGVFGSSLCFREVLALYLGEYDHYLH